MSNKSKNPPVRTGPSGPLLAGVVAAVLLLVVFAVVFVAGGDDNDDSGDGDATSSTTEPGTPSQEYGIVTIDGDPLPRLEDGDDAAVGQVAPAVVSERASGVERIDPGQEEQPTVVILLAHWCPHCQRELPLLVEMLDAGAFDGVRPVAVATNSTDSRPNFPPSAWFDDEGWTGDRIYDDRQSSAAAAYGLSSFPMMVFLDADGRVTQRLSGEQSKEAIQAAVDELTA